MRAGGWLLVGAAGFVVMLAASVWAPTQPELFDTGAACQLAPCGTLEDPARWRQAWWLWGAGAAVSLVAAACVLAPRRPTWRAVLLLVVSAVLLLVPLAVLAYLLSLATSVHGAATVALAVPLVWVAVLVSWVRNRVAGAE